MAPKAFMLLYESKFPICGGWYSCCQPDDAADGEHPLWEVEVAGPNELV